MKLTIVLAAMSVLIYSCEHIQREKQPVTKAYKYRAPLDDRQLILRLQDSIIKYGDGKAFNKLASYYVLEGWNEELLYYALLMANKYNSAEGHYHVFYGLSTPRTGETIEMLDERTKNFSKYHLLKAYEMGFENAKYKAEEVFGDSTPLPNSSYYLQEFIKSER